MFGLAHFLFCVSVKVKLTITLLCVCVYSAWEGCPRNDLYFVRRDVKPYSLTHSFRSGHFLLHQWLIGSNFFWLLFVFFGFVCDKSAMCAFMSRTTAALLQHNQKETVSLHKNLSKGTDHDIHGMNRNISAHDSQTSRAYVSHDNNDRMPFSKPNSIHCFPEFDKELADKRCHKRLHSPDAVEKPPVKLQCKTEVDKNGRNTVAADHKPIAEETSSVNISAEGNQPSPKTKRPAENLTVGTPFDLASYLDQARKMTRRDFDPDSVTVIQQLNKGFCLLHVRPEFNGSETLSEELGDSSENTSPLQLCHSDTDCSIRLGALIAATIEQHVDMKKLEQTAKSVSHRLQHGTTKSSEREVVHRQKPVLISTMPSPSTSNIRGKIPSTSIGMSKVSDDQQQSLGHVSAKCHQNILDTPSTVPQAGSDIRDKPQSASTGTNYMPHISHDQQQPAARNDQNMLHTSNSVLPHLTSVGKSRGSGQVKVSAGSCQGFRAVARTAASNVVKSVIVPSADVMLSGSRDTQSARRPTLGRSATRDSHSQSDNLSLGRVNSAMHLKKDNRSGLLD